MAAVEHGEAIAPKAPSRQRASLLILLTLAAAYALTVLVFYPGYSTVASPSQTERRAATSASGPKASQ